MYGEADYFMIDDLKACALAHFRGIFVDQPENVSFADTVQELYSMRANYRAIRDVAMDTSLFRNLERHLEGQVLRLDLRAERLRAE